LHQQPRPTGRPGCAPTPTAGFRPAKFRTRGSDAASDLQQRINEATRQTETVAQRIHELTHVLPAALRTSPPQVDFHRLKKAPAVVPLNLDGQRLRRP